LRVIVVDDGSTDGSRAVLERYGTIRVTLILQENGGQAVAMRGLRPRAATS
jgi:glycosyltransferase involved in cell wall biosynthesis